MDQPELAGAFAWQTVACASWGRRAVAFMLDILLVVDAIVGLYVLAWISGGYDYETDPLAGAWVAIYLPLFVLGPPTYFWLMIGRNGATIGKRAMGIRVRRCGDDDVGRVGYLRALGREASWLLLALFGFPLLLSILWPLWDARNQTLVDKMASTVVVLVPA